MLRRGQGGGRFVRLGGLLLLGMSEWRRLGFVGVEDRWEVMGGGDGDVGWGGGGFAVDTEGFDVSSLLALAVVWAGTCVQGLAAEDSYEGG